MPPQDDPSNSVSQRPIELMERCRLGARGGQRPSLLLIAAMLAVCAGAGAQTIPAFPGAEGAGGFAKGGRGGDVYHVTNTNASGAGSLAYGLTTGVPSAGRTIVFDVSGYAHISGTLRVTASKITIAGQTAPGDGFGLKDGTFLVSSDDIIIRHLRFRDGNSADAIDLDSGSLNSIFDHCDAMFSNDENMSSFNSAPENMTFQWSLNAWGMESHSCGGLWDQNHVTSHHSLWAHNHTRNPKARTLLLDWVNNVTFDWDIGFILGDSDTPANWNTNVIGNYFIAGTSGKTKALEKGARDRNGNWNFHVYLANNRFDGNRNGLVDGTDTGYGMLSGDVEHLAAPLVNTGIPVTTDDPLTAYKKIVSAAGPLRLDVDAGKPLRDEVDALLITKLVAQSHFHVSSAAGTGLANGGFGTLASAPPPVDTDRDGMPDFWEDALGFNKAVDDHNTVFPSTGGFITGTTFFPANTVAGYTRLEEYLHFLAIPHGTVAKNVSGAPTSILIDLKKFTPGFTASPVFTLANVSSGTAAQSGAGNSVVTFTPTQAFVGRARFEFTVSDSAGSSWTQTCALLVTPSGLPRDLVWKGDNAANTWDGATNNWLRNGAATAFSSGDRVASDDTGSNTPALALGGTVSPGSVDFDATENYSLGGAGAITSTGALTKRGSGTLTIGNAGPNAFSSATLESGTLALNTYAGAGTGALTVGSGTLSLGAGVPNSLVINGPTLITMTANQEVTGAWSGAGTVTVATANTFTLHGNTSAFAGTISLGASSGYLRLYTSLGSPQATFDLGTNTGRLTNRDGNATVELGALTGGAGTTLSGASAANPVTYRIGATGNDTTFSGAITNGGGVTSIEKIGSGMLTIAGTGSHTGTTTVSAGTLLLNGSLGLTATTVASGAALMGAGSIGGAITVQSGGIVEPGSAAGAVGTLTAAGGFSATSTTFHFDLSNSPAGSNDKIYVTGGSSYVAGTNTFMVNFKDGVLGAGVYKLIECAPGIPATAQSGVGLNLTTSAPAGTRQIFTMGRDASGTAGGNVRLTVTGNAASLTWVGAVSGAAWDLQTTANFSGANPGTFYNLDAVTFDDTSANRSITLTGSLAPRSLVMNTTLGYTLGGAGTLDGTASLVKNGAGTLTLAGTAANTFSGGLTLNAGTIVLANDAANAGALGTGPVTLNGGVISMHDDAVSYNAFNANLVVPAGATARLNADSRVDMYGTLSGAGTLNFFIPYIRTDLYTDWSAFTGIINVLSDAGGGNFRMATSYSFPGFPRAAIALTDNVSAYYTGTLSAGAGTTIEIGELSGTVLSGLKGGATGGRNFTYRIGGRNTDAVFAGTIAEQNTGTTTSFVKTGTGTWTLGGTCNWNGGLTVELGTLKISGSVTCGAAVNVAPPAGYTSALVFAGGTLHSDAVNFSSGTTFTGNGTIDGDLNVSTGAMVTCGTGTLAVTRDVVNNGTMRFTGGATLNATGSFVNNGVLDLLTGAQGLPANLINNGAVIDSSSLSQAQASQNGTTFTVKVRTYAGHAYQLQRAISLTAPTWTDVGTPQTGDGSVRDFIDTGATGAQRFYRVLLTP